MRYVLLNMVVLVAGCAMEGRNTPVAGPGPASQPVASPVPSAPQYATASSSAGQVVPAIWREGDIPGTLRLKGGRNSPVSVRAYVTARDGSERQIWSANLTSGSSLPLPAEPFGVAGHYRLELGNGSSASSIAVAVIGHPLARGLTAPIFGLNTHFGQRAIPDAAYGIIAMANADAIRDQWVWSKVETKVGEPSLTIDPNGGIPHQKQMLLSSNLKILHNCAYTNRLYDNGKFPTSPMAISAYAHYCSVVAQGFGDSLYGSEIWNESNKIDPKAQYSPLAAATSSELKRTTPYAEILEGGGAGPGGGANPSYEETVYRTIGASCCTGFSIHPYMTNPDVGYLAANGPLRNPLDNQPIVNMEFVLFWTDELSQKMGKPHASHFTEIGWSTANDGKSGVSELKQAAFLGRTLIHATKPSPCTLDSGLSSPDIAKHCTPHINATTPDLKSIFVYDFQDDGPNPVNTEHNFGIVHQDLTPKMGYSAFAQAAGVLRGATFAKWVHFAPKSKSNAYIYRTQDGMSLVALWTSEFVPAGPVKLSADMDYPHEGVTKSRLSLGLVGGGSLAQVSVECREWDGHPCTVNLSSIEISNLPVYLTIPLPPEKLVIREQNET